MPTSFYPIGTPGQPWGHAERQQWLSQQRRQRSYAKDVLERLQALSADGFDVQAYGEINSGDQRYPLMGVRVKAPGAVNSAAHSQEGSQSKLTSAVVSAAPAVLASAQDQAPRRRLVLITGGVHGYETSGVWGALAFLEHHALHYADRFDLWVAPCVSPWAYEHIQRWNAQAIDPNRSFHPPWRPKPATAIPVLAEESVALMRWIEPVYAQFALHLDLHETTDTDESEFRPAVAARDGRTFEPGSIPDGFYVVDDSTHPSPWLQQAIIERVGQVTHIAPADAQGRLIGTPIVAPGVIQFDLGRTGLCGGLTGAPTSTTEVYPDSPRTSPQNCTAAQVAAVCGALDSLS